MAYQPSNDPGPNWNLALNPQNEVTAQMDTIFPNLETGQLFQNVCHMRPKIQYPKWPQAMASFTHGQLDKPPQEEPDPAFSAQFEKPFITSAPDPYLLVPPPPLLAAAPLPAGSQTPLHDPVAPPQVFPRPRPPTPAPAKPPAPKKKVEIPKLAPSPPPPPCNDCDCKFGSPGFGLQKIPACMLKSISAFFNHLFNWKNIPGTSFGSKLGHLFFDNTRIFYLLVWLVLILFAIHWIYKLT